MGKKNLTKSEDQKSKLERFYAKKSSNWDREEIIKFSKSIGLTRQQVYKWLWDKKKGETKKVKVQASESDSNVSYYDFVPVKYQRYTLSIPSNKQQPLEFVVHPETSKWAINILRTQGWQLVRSKQNERFSDCIDLMEQSHEIHSRQEINIKRQRSQLDDIYESHS